ncbi:MAG TPA: DUF3089 domain-containing protein [Candidatus Binatia bacterium]|jgi:hypothetical protein|nr:DUF3089 domain-containing protein [Candidatus Binatia bacterium]
MRTRRLVPLAVALVLSALAGPVAAQGENPYPGYTSAIYADPANWLCRPDMDDVCDHGLDATEVKANGHTSIERWKPARQPKIDCFYIYPTISTDTTGNSDLIPGADQELFVVGQQAARLGSVCRVFAPVYRQITLTALLSIIGGNPIPFDAQLAVDDVVDAWKHYIANDNHGRGVILIGHSQGASQLTGLLQSEIDGNAVLRDRVVSAMLLGTSFQVPVGEDIGGSLANMPLCHRDTDTGCIISYASFRAEAPPPADSRFGRSLQPGWEAACTNPASLRGGKGTLHPYLPTDARALPILPPPPPPQWVDPAKGVTIDTPFVTLPRWVTGECQKRDGFVYLSIASTGNTAHRVDDLSGADLTPDWGLHLVDANIAMGDLLAIARRQSRTYCQSHECSAAR